MADGATHEQISRLEGRIEELAEAADRCRKIALAARVAVGAGVVLLAVILIGVIRADGLSLIVAAILGIGGIVVFGSNDATAKQIAADIAQAEQLRAELISGIDLRMVAVPPRVLH